MSPNPKHSFVCPSIADLKHRMMPTNTELGAFVYPNSQQYCHTMTYDPELGATIRKYNTEKSGLHSILEKVMQFIVICSIFSIIINSLFVGFFAVMNLINYHAAQQWLRDGPWGIAIWVFLGLNIVMAVAMAVLDLMLDE
ncbi:hypothetical protein G6011_00138 [Alternaria panax]|uniref:Uncharacterized protein n=1 Tax=Alternaria panax TaxID=48097 RepID=A0AAD4IHN7_9PLEO|nr:hypothetical protein G6011_00138 [Alternaria panax]